MRQLRGDGLLAIDLVTHLLVRPAQLLLELLSRRLDLGLVIFPRFEQLALLEELELHLFDLPPEIGGKRALVGERLVRRSKGSLARVEGRLGRFAELDHLSIGFGFRRQAGLGGGGLCFFGGDAREIQNQSRERFPAARIGEHRLENGEPLEELAAKAG